MADGTTKDIEDVQPGDKVQATDPVTGQNGPREVTRLIVTRNEKHFNELFIVTDGGIEQLTATRGHPFWSPSGKNWIEAGNLTSGMTLLAGSGDTVTISGDWAYSELATTYNITVNCLHAYYVLAGETPVLVHNSNCGPELSINEGQFGKKWESNLRTTASTLAMPLPDSCSATKSPRFAGGMTKYGRVRGIRRMAVEVITSSTAEGTVP